MCVCVCVCVCVCLCVHVRKRPTDGASRHWCDDDSKSIATIGQKFSKTLRSGKPPPLLPTMSTTDYVQLCGCRASRTAQHRATSHDNQIHARSLPFHSCLLPSLLRSVANPLQNTCNTCYHRDQLIAARMLSHEA